MSVFFFLSGESSSPPVRPPRGVKPKKTVAMDVDADDDDSSRVNFDHEAFSCAVQNILGSLFTF